MARIDPHDAWLPAVWTIMSNSVDRKRWIVIVCHRLRIKHGSINIQTAPLAWWPAILYQQWEALWQAQDGDR